MNKAQQLFDEVIKTGEVARGVGGGFVLSLPPGAIENIDWSATNVSEWYQNNRSLLEGISLERIDTDADKEIADTYLLALEVTQRMSIEASRIPAEYFETTGRVGSCR